MSSDNNCPATELLATEHHRTGKYLASIFMASHLGPYSQNFIFFVTYE
jgi:hypothetical protein